MSLDVGQSRCSYLYILWAIFLVICCCCCVLAIWQTPDRIVYVLSLIFLFFFIIILIIIGDVGNGYGGDMDVGAKILVTAHSIYIQRAKQTT